MKWEPRKWENKGEPRILSMAPHSPTKSNANERLKETVGTYTAGALKFVPCGKYKIEAIQLPLES